MLEDRNNGFSVYKTAAVSIGPHASARMLCCSNIGSGGAMGIGLCLRMARRTRDGVACGPVDSRRLAPAAWQSSRPAAWRLAPTRGGACARGVAELAPRGMAACAHSWKSSRPCGSLRRWWNPLATVVESGLRGGLTMGQLAMATESRRHRMKRENHSQCCFVAVSNLLETALKRFTGMKRIPSPSSQFHAKI